jgi:hypothetical protein
LAPDELQGCRGKITNSRHQAKLRFPPPGRATSRSCCGRSVGGATGQRCRMASQMRVYNTNVLDDLVESASEEKRKSDASRSASQMSAADPEQTMEEKMAERERWRRDMRAEEYQNRMEKLQKDVATRLQRQVDMRELRFQEMDKAFEAENSGFAAELFKTCDYKDATDRRRVKMMYKEWEEQVFDKIQRRVCTRIDARSSTDIEREKQAMYQEFLDATNRKDGLFRDIIIESDYDPLNWREESLKYSAKVEDPVKRELTRMANDREGIGGKGAGIPAARSKEILDVKMWDKLEATPHGKAAEMFAASAAGIKKPISKTQITTTKIDHYDIDRNAKTATHELHGYYATKGRKTFAGEHGHFALD